LVDFEAHVLIAFLERLQKLAEETEETEEIEETELSVDDSLEHR
jgi:hypothetical protein